uniref:non-specific serine/threonine protein kinase n=1 Tax=Leersia perrieri TaxID=77586 RepID=A0A0D9XZV4_9ORYZ
MEDLPDALISEITKRIENRSDLSSLSLVSKRLYKIEAETRGSIHVGCGLHPATDVILSLCSRFPNLLKVDINYSGWTRSHGNQLDNHGICILSSYCPGLSDLTLSFCSDISDSGIGYLASCKKLITLRLNSAKIITSSGLLAVVVGCNNLSGLHLVNCNKICGTSEWLKYLGCNGSLEELVVKNCEQISQFDLLMFGPGWMKLKSFMFVVRSIYNIFDPKDRSYVVNCKYRYDFCCENLKELSLERIVTVEEKGLCSLLGKCRSLEKVCLHFIHGLTDSDMITLAQNCSNLRCISLQLEPVFCEEPEGRVFRTPLTDQSLKVLALGCRMLQIVELTMFACEPIYPEIGFTQEGLVSFFQSCPIRDLVLCGANIFNDEGMKALSSAHFLETLELMDCKRVTDAGVRLLADSPSLVSLTLRQCDGFSDVGVGAVVCARKLESLIVEDLLLKSSDKAVLALYIKGVMPDGQEVAVKMLHDTKGDDESFLNEITTISKISHVNIVTLLGFCLNGSKAALIYEYMCNGSPNNADGNFSDRSTAWDSFNYPTDTLLPGMKLGLDVKAGITWDIIAWIRPNNPNSGLCTFKLVQGGMPEFFITKGNRKLYGTEPFNGKEFTGMPHFEEESQDFSSNVIYNPNETSYNYFNNDPKLLSWIIMNEIACKDMGLVWSNGEWRNEWQYPTDVCDDYARCGSFGYFDLNNEYRLYNCLRRFKPWSSRKHWSLQHERGHRCIRVTNLTWDHGDGFFFMNWMKLPDVTRATLYADISLEQYRQVCLKNCSCQAYAVPNINRGVHQGCVIWGDDLLDMRRSLHLVRLYFTMEDLPDVLIIDIVKRIDSTNDLSSLSLGHGNQLDNHGLHILSSYCPSLSDLTLSFCSYIDDTGFGYLALCKKLMTLRLNSVKRITSSGLLVVAVGCKNLSGLHLIDCNAIHGTFEWLKYLGIDGSLEELVVKNCKGISQYDLLLFGPGWIKLRRFVFAVRTLYKIYKPRDPSNVANYQYNYDL